MHLQSRDFYREAPAFAKVKESLHPCMGEDKTVFPWMFTDSRLPPQGLLVDNDSKLPQLNWQYYGQINKDQDDTNEILLRVMVSNKA